MTETKETHAATPQEINDIVAPAVVYQERLNMPGVAERVAREQYEDLTGRLTHYRADSALCQRSAPHVIFK